MLAFFADCREGFSVCFGRFLGWVVREKLPSQGTSTGSPFEPRRESVPGGLKVASMRPDRFDFQPHIRALDMFLFSSLSGRADWICLRTLSRFVFL